MSVKISVIIPVYNASKTLRKCVESIVYGKEKEIEVILVEDCSKDKSYELCKELEKEFTQVRCIQNERNSGVSYTRNHGLKEAKGKYITFVDSDDWTSKNYLVTLINTLENNKNCLVMCGFKYLDYMNNNNHIYTYDNEEYSKIDSNSFFYLIDKILIQFVWNKIFIRDIINENNIMFDENQKMGEDFEFVLDYMKTINCKNCIVINQPLYYYVRANNTSLMSNFGKVNQENEYSRMNKFLSIIGENEISINSYNKAIANIKNNYVYHIVRDKKLNKEDKIKYIYNVDNEFDLNSIYKSQMKIVFKENIVNSIANIKNLYNRILGKIHREKNLRLIKKVKSNFKSKDFTIISQNCIGGVFYHDMELQFKSPTINLFIKQPDFIKFVNNLNYYLNLDIQMEWDEEYPIGKLDDITIYFMHYETCKEAYDAWNRRKERINYDKLIVLSTDRDGFTKEIFEEWKKIKYPKILFTANEEYTKYEDSIYFPQYKDNGFILDLIPNREFYKDDILINKINSL